MVAIVDNLVLQSSITTGTGALTLTAATGGYQTFNGAFGNGATTDVFYYFISNAAATEWEVGTGHMSASTTLSRDTVLKSSNANALVSFSAGTKTVVCDVPAALHVIGAAASTSTAIAVWTGTTGNRIANSLVLIDSSGNITGVASEIITSTSANALAVGINGSTNPVFRVDCSVASTVNGISLVGGATGTAPSFTNIGSDTNGAGLGLIFKARTATASGSGGSLSFVGGNGLTNGSGGNLSYTAGDGVGTGAGGNVTITGGASGTSGFPSAGNVTITGGVNNSSGGGDNGGDVFINGGSAGNGTGGNVTISSGAGSSGHGSGNVSIVGITSANASGGTVTIASGGSLTTQSGVPTTISGGSGGTSGNQPGGAGILQGGIGNAAGGGGTGQLLGGVGGATGAGGIAQVQGGAGGSTSGNGGAVTISGGIPTVGAGGSITISGAAGVGTNMNGGNVTLSGGAATGTGTAGNVIINGVVSGTAISTSGSANTLALRDSSGNLTANAVICGYATTVTAAGTTTLSATSAQIQRFTGTTTQIVKLSATTALANGYETTIINDSTGIVTVQTNAAGALTTVPGGTNLTFTVTGASNNWSFTGAVANALASSYVVPATQGGTGQITLASSFAALFETVATAVGDIVFGGTAGAPTRLAGNTSATPSFYTSTGTGSAAQAPTLTSSTGTGAVVLASGATMTLANATGLPLTTGTTGLLPNTKGGTGLDSSAQTGVAQLAAGTWMFSTGLVNGTTANTQTAGDNSTKVATTAYVDTNKTVLATPIATTSGTSFNFSGIPSTAKIIRVNFAQVTIGSGAACVQLGTSSGIVTTGYVGIVASISTGGGGAGQVQTVGIPVCATGAYTFTGTLTLTLENSSTNTWCASGTCSSSGPNNTVNMFGGKISLSGALSQLTLTSVAGTTAYSSGEVNISYQ